MPSSHWDSGVRKFGHVEYEEEEWTPHSRPGATAASNPRFDHEEELARQHEIEEAEEREREQERAERERVAFHREQERLRKRVARGETRVIDLRKKREDV